MINDALIQELVQREIAKDETQQRFEMPELGAAVPVQAPHVPGALLGAAAAASGADAATTLYGLTHGYHESNPMYNFAGPKMAVPLSLGIDAATYALGKKFLGKSHPKILNALLAAGGVSHGIAAVQNLKLLHDDPAGK